MSRTLRAASLAAVALCVSASVAATDPSFAFDSDFVPIEQPVNEATSSSVPAAAEAPTNDRIVFAPRAEIVQDIPATTVSETSHSSLASLVSAQVMPAALDRETECLAGAVYFEAKGESLDGQLAVAEVVLNRSESGRFPASVCGVVFQPRQFSFVRGGGFPPINRDSRAWQHAVAIAQIAKNDHWDSSVEDALFFHASRVSPGWKRQRVAQLGNHVFYR